MFFLKRCNCENIGASSSATRQKIPWIRTFCNCISFVLFSGKRPDLFRADCKHVYIRDGVGLSLESSLSASSLASSSKLLSLVFCCFVCGSSNSAFVLEKSNQLIIFTWRMTSDTHTSVQKQGSKVNYLISFWVPTVHRASTQRFVQSWGTLLPQWTIKEKAQSLASKASSTISMRAWWYSRLFRTWSLAFLKYPWQQTLIIERWTLFKATCTDDWLLRWQNKIHFRHF